MYRYIPYLGIRKLTPEEVIMFDLDQGFRYTALLFEWFSYSILLIAVGKMEKNKSAD